MYHVILGETVYSAQVLKGNREYLFILILIVMSMVFFPFTIHLNYKLKLKQDIFKDSIIPMSKIYVEMIYQEYKAFISGR